MIGEFVLNCNRTKPLSLDVLAKKYLGYGKKHFVNLCMKAGVDPEDIPKSKLIERCNDDILQTRDLFLLQREIVEKAGLLGCVHTRCILSPALADIESKGMCLDAEAVTALYTERAAKLAETTSEMDIFTDGINPRSPVQVREFVYEELKFKPKTVGRGKTPVYSTRTEDLLALKATNKRQRKFVELKKEWSGYNADVTKNLLFFQGVVQDKNPEGPIFYASFNQCVAKTHRLSSSGIKRTFPHMLDDKGKPVTKSVQFQNFKREFKPIMKARNDGWSMGEADGSQLEFRVAGYLGQCPVVTQEVVDGVDVHKQSASIINGVHVDEVTGDMRTAAKADTFKPLFGGKSGTEGQKKYYAWFAEHYYGVADTQQDWMDEAVRSKKVKFVTNFVGYWPYCKISQSGYIEESTKICNYFVQSFATAEIIPIAIVYLWHMMRDMESFLVNTIHDSGIAELHPEEHEEFKEVSLHAFTHLVYYYLKEVYDVEFNLPLGVGVKIGRNWGTGVEVACTPMPPYKMEGVDYDNLIKGWVD